MLDGWQRLIQFKILRMDAWAGLKEPWYLHEHLDDYYYMWLAKMHMAAPKILGTDIRQLGLRFSLDFSMLGIGGLMGVAVATSVLLGGIINLAILAPIMIQHGDIVARTLANGHVVQISRAEIVNQWSIWWGVSMMVVGAMAGLFAKPELFTKAFKSMRKMAGAPRSRATTCSSTSRCRCGCRGSACRCSACSAPGPRTSSSACPGCCRWCRCR